MLPRLNSAAGSCAGLLVQDGANIPERHHQRHWLSGAGVKAEGEIEALGLIGDRLDDNATDADSIGGIGHPQRGVAEQGAADALNAPGSVHGEASQNGDRNGIRHVPPEPAGGGVHGDGAGSESVVGDDAVVSRDNVGSAGAADLVGARTAFEPVVLGGLAGIESPKFVVVR